MSTARVVVTGVGTVNALGPGGRGALSGMLESGRTGIAPVRAFAVDGSPSRLAAEVDPAVLEPLIDRDAGRRLSRVCQLVVAACRVAVEDAAVSSGADLGIVLGTEHGDFRSSEEFAAGFLRRGPAGLSPMLFPNTVMNSMAAQAAIAMGAQGPTVTLNQATVSGDLAIARGAALIRSGRARAVLAGGADEICGPVYRRLAALAVLSPMGRTTPEGCRPFAPDHNGPVLGEGATIVVLEAESAARARGAPILAILAAEAWRTLRAAPHTAPVGRRDPRSPVRRILEETGGPPIARAYGAGNGDPLLDDWETRLLAADVDGGASALSPPRSLAPLFGQHGGIGALRVAAAALDVQALDASVLVHGLARGGCRTALLLGPVA